MQQDGFWGGWGNVITLCPGSGGFRVGGGTGSAMPPFFINDGPGALDRKPRTGVYMFCI